MNQLVLGDGELEIDETEDTERAVSEDRESELSSRASIGNRPLKQAVREGERPKKPIDTGVELMEEERAFLDLLGVSNDEVEALVRGNAPTRRRVAGYLEYLEGIPWNRERVHGYRMLLSDRWGLQKKKAVPMDRLARSMDLRTTVMRNRLQEAIAAFTDLAGLAGDLDDTRVRDLPKLPAPDTAAIARILAGAQ